MDQQVENHSLDLTCFGHMGRVFRSVLAEYGGQRYLLSVGEDSRICGWDMNGRLAFRRDLRAGGTLWTVVVAQGIIYATTSSGGLEMLAFEDALRVNTLSTVRSDLFQNNNYPAKIRFMSPDQIVCITNANELKLICYTNGSWEETCSIDVHCDKTQVLAVRGKLIALGGFGRICVYKCERRKLALHADSKCVPSLIRSMHWVADSGDQQGDHCLSLFVVNDRAEGFLLDTGLDMQNQKQVDLKCCCRGKERWATSVFRFRDFLVIADRHGNLHSFSIEDSSDGTAEMYRGTLHKVHGHLGITGMYKSAEYCFTTTGHDGIIRTICMDKFTGAMSVWRSQRVPIKWIERIEGDVVMGFNDSHFVMWNRDSRQITLEIDCGGGHRFWDFVRQLGNMRGRFIFIKNRQLQLVDDICLLERGKAVDFNATSSQWHTTPTNCLKIWSVDGCKYVISGGEEGLIKIHELLPRGDDLAYRDELTAHIANIRTMAIRQLNDNSCLLFSGGGRAQLCVHWLMHSAEGLIIRECSNYMCKGVDLDRGRKGDNQQRVDFDPETRLMSLIVEGDRIVAGCSDGYIRVFKYDEESVRMSLAGEYFYGKCILQMGELVLKSGQRFILTMATDGVVNFWAVGDFGEPSFALKHHDSGINAWDCWKIEGSDGEFWIVTGGDDQGISGTRIKIHEDGAHIFTVITDFKYLYRHTAQISGIKILDNDRFVSVAVDQEIFEHKLESFDVYRNVSFTSVSDVKGLVVVDKDRFITFGAGVEINRV